MSRQTFPGGGPRVVSLVPSVTETLLHWGIKPVGVTRFCEQPSMRAFGGTKDPDVAGILALAPDLVVLNDEENRKEDHDAFVAANQRVLVLRITSLADVEPAMGQLAAACGCELPVMPLLPPNLPHRLRAFVPIWRRPWMTFNGATYGSSLLNRLGVRNVFADAPDRYHSVTVEDIAAQRPDVILAPTEPYPFAERHAAELAEISPMVLVDGQDLFWWGSRTPTALVRLGAHIATIAAAHD